MQSMTNEIFLKFFNPSADSMAAGESNTINRFKTFPGDIPQKTCLLNIPQIPPPVRNAFGENGARPPTTRAKESWNR